MREPLQPDATATGLPSSTEEKTVPSAARQVLRMIVGTTLLAVESAGSALQRVCTSERNDEPTTNAPLAPPSARHVLIGALVVGPEFVVGSFTIASWQRCRPFRGGDWRSL
jgi:hypothetical protein